jgi:hypothetical protein
MKNALVYYNACVVFVKSKVVRLAPYSKHPLYLKMDRFWETVGASRVAR